MFDIQMKEPGHFYTYMHIYAKGGYYSKKIKFTDFQFDEYKLLDMPWP